MYPLHQVAGVDTETPEDDEWLGVRLPVDASGGIVDGILLEWLLLHDPKVALFDPKVGEGIREIGARFWLDVGANDELGLEDDLLSFGPALTAQLPLGDVFVETYAGGHGDQLRERLERSLPWASQALEESIQGP